MKRTAYYLISFFLLGWCGFWGYAQDKQYLWQQSPKAGEKEIGVVTKTVNAGESKDSFTDGLGYHSAYDSRTTYTEEELYSMLLSFAKEEYSDYSSKMSLRSFISHMEEDRSRSSTFGYYLIKRFYKLSAIVVIPDPKELANVNISNALEKALKKVPQGSRLSIDQVIVWSGINREDYIDQIIDVLLGKGYKVVAKEYLQKLYEEQQNQKSGIYNVGTTVEENNFSAVGYYLNVKVTETSLRVQVINVSTGEYEGNATVSF